MDPNVAILPVVTKDLPISPRFTPYELFIAMQVQHSYNSTNGWTLLTCTYDFRTTSKCVARTIDRLSDES